MLSYLNTVFRQDNTKLMSAVHVGNDILHPVARGLFAGQNPKFTKQPKLPTYLARKICRIKWLIAVESDVTQWTAMVDGPGKTLSGPSPMDASGELSLDVEG
ncbi:unnamed protein product [Spodoptera exigua]|nr:unnamed protein product [Spodoptera exigua]